ncbi:MAG TPA: hypothetical protein VKA84_10465, partial [Gemmatimonadaceae bacterium]|nr:hypothetical protein [Gemmatimonadaceae bacterium]
MRRTQEPRVEDTTRWGAGVAAVLLLYAAAGACRDNPTQPPAPDPNEVRATIGAAGGTLASRDGNVTITFPAGALASTRELTIRPIAAGELGAEFAGVEVARAYELGPTGLAFQSPATVTLRTDQQARQADGTLRLVPHILLTSRNGVVERLDDLSVVMSGDSVLARGRLTHFSPLVEQKTQQPIGWFEITGIPDQLEVGLVATIQARASIPVLDVTTAEYHDAAVDSPLRTAFPLMALLEADAGMYRRSIAYACEQTGEGIFQAYVQIVTSGNQNGDVAPWLRSATLRGDVRKATACIPAAIFTLTVNLSGGGTGSVTSVTNPPRTPPDISCPGNCNGNFTRGTLVGLAATPAAGSRFVGWSGACSGADPLGTVVVDDNRTCVAQFEATPRHTLTVTTSGDGAGTILKFPAGTGTDCGSNCAEYFEGATVLVSADHDANSVFAGWSGDCTGESTTTVVMNADKACTARFARVERTLTVTVAPEGTGRGTVATSPPGGIDCGADCSEQYPHGTAVALVAVPDENSVFAGWSGACSGSGPAVVTMDADKTCTARFDPKPRTLTVTKTGGGSGVVASTPAGIECGNDCTEQYPHGTGVALLATPDEGSIFVAWSVACPGGSGTTTVVMDADKSCSAQFDLIARTLTVTTTGDGAGSVGSFPPGIACGSGSTDCTEQYPHGTSVTLAAAAGDGSVFAGWSGACSGSGLTATVTTDADKSCTARFDRVKFSLRIATDGDGRGSVASAPAGIACGAGGTGCAALFDPGTSVTLTATAASGSRFVAWAGDGCTGSAPATTVAMTADRNCTATFALVRYTLGVERTGTGSGRVTSDPAGIDCGTACSADLLQGARVVLTAAADEGSYFAVWTGDCSGSSPNAFVTMDADRICSARFELLSARRLTVAISGSGQGSVSGGDALSLVSCPGGDCTALFPPGATVRLQAVAGAGSR